MAVDNMFPFDGLSEMQRIRDLEDEPGSSENSPHIPQLEYFYPEIVDKSPLPAPTSSDSEESYSSPRKFELVAQMRRILVREDEAFSSMRFYYPEIISNNDDKDSHTHKLGNHMRACFKVGFKAVYRI